MMPRVVVCCDGYRLVETVSGWVWEAHSGTTALGDAIWLRVKPDESAHVSAVLSMAAKALSALVPAAAPAIDVSAVLSMAGSIPNGA